MSFALETYQNEYLPSGAGEMHAVVKVTSSGGQAASASAEKAVVLVVDTSGSMTGSKLRAAQGAAAAAIALLPDGTRFALVAGYHRARCVYPDCDHGLVVADPVTRTRGIEATRRLRIGSGTAISTWIDKARQILEPHPDVIRLAYLVTDGQNVGEAPELLEAAVARAAGVFQCDTRGVGDDWAVSELREISSVLLGEVDIIKSADGMERDFRAFLDRALGRNIGDVRLRVWSPKGSHLRFLRQTHPSIEDLGAGAVDPQTVEYPTGAWAGDESRDYHICVDVPPGQVGDEKLASRITLVVGGAAVDEGLVRAVWTDDEARSTKLNREVAHCTGQAELATVIQEGLQARQEGDTATATMKLGRAAELASATGNDATLRLLGNVVDVDASTGTVRLKRDVARVSVMELDTRSTRTTRVHRNDSGSPE